MDWKDEGGGCDVRRNPFVSFSDTESESEGFVGDDVKDGKCEVAKVKREPDVKTQKGACYRCLKGSWFTEKESRRFLRKNTGIGPGAGSVAAKMKASIMVSKVVNKDEEYDKPASEPNVKDDGLEELDTTETEDQIIADEVESRMSPESEILINSESENGNTSQSFLQVDHTSVAELPATVTSPFPVQDSPGESPMSWNSHTNYPFSFNHEASDFESPMRSPASWNLQPTEADAARRRKKWGIVKKSSPIANSSGLQSRKDMAKGFKRLLKFGRKSRHTDNLSDYISATTFEFLRRR
ncbi:hypothetical protein CTI12_AA409400 [Artemisia annua]|uniref:Uncharacterized protein n=1 Tax=Artemisia annua TaxID=35608 RepID=A0A2U1M7K1_ARTAN|nr:hypothetical protein CTI12_AA409400 [Artemisia annua]